jgi:GNAT superfamily N-acetyltransferase
MSSISSGAAHQDVASATASKLPARAAISSASVRKIWAAEKHLFRDHLLRLDSNSRRLRFAHGVSDSFIQAYADRMDDMGSIVFGYFDNGQVRAAAELRKSSDIWGKKAEAAFSVEPAYQDQGIGSALMGRIIRSARNRGVRLLYMTCLAENAKIQAIARKYAAELRFESGEVFGEIMPSGPDYFSLLAEAAEDRVGCIMAALDFQTRLTRAA